MHILHHISANSHTCGSDAITFVGSMSCLEVTLTVCHNIGLLRLCLPKIEGCTKFRSKLVPSSVLAILEFRRNLSFFFFQRLILAV